MNTSCLLSIAQLLRESPRLDNIKEKEKQDKHLIIVTSTQIDHDMLISVKVGWEEVITLCVLTHL